MANDDIKKFNSSKQPPQESLLSKLERQVDDSIKTQIAINKKKQQEKATALSFYNVNLPATARASSPMPPFPTTQTSPYPVTPKVPTDLLSRLLGNTAVQVGLGAVGAVYGGISSRSGTALGLTLETIMSLPQNIRENILTPYQSLEDFKKRANSEGEREPTFVDGTAPTMSPTEAALKTIFPTAEELTGYDPVLPKTFIDAKQAAAEEGKNFAEQILAGWGAAKEAELPVDTLSLPFTLQPGPEWLIGDRRIKDIQVGLRGAYQLPAEIAMDFATGKAAGTGYKLAKAKVKTALSKKIPWEGLQPGSPEWIDFAQKNPKHVQAMADYAHKVKSGGDKVVSGQPIKRLTDPPPTTKTPFSETADKVWTNIQAYITDTKVRINQSTTRIRNHVEKWKSRTGEGLPDDYNASAWFQTMPGVSIAGIRYFGHSIKEMKQAVGKNVNFSELGEYIALRNKEKIYEMKPDRVGVKEGFKNVQEIRQRIKEMAERLGEDGMASIQRGADVYIRVMDEMAEELQKAGLISEAFRTFLRERNPYYHPIRYLQDGVEDVTFGRPPTASITGDFIKILQDFDLDAFIANPTDELLDYITSVKRMTHRNEAVKSFLAGAAFDPKLMNLIRRIDADSAVRLGEKIVYSMEDGNVVKHAVPDYVKAGLDKAVGLDNRMMNVLGGVMGYVQAPFRETFTQANPIFWAGAYMVDNLSVFMQHRVLPHTVLARAWEVMLDPIKADPILRKFEWHGGNPVGFVGDSAKTLEKRARKKGQLFISNNKEWLRYLNPLVHLQGVSSVVHHIGHALEMAPRTAVFMKTGERGTPLMQAVAHGRSVTLDHQRIGHAMKIANQLWIYSNAASQGFLLPIRATRDLPQFRMGMAGFAGLLGTLEMYNRQYPEYFDVPLRDRYGAFLIMLPSTEARRDGREGVEPHYITVIPNTREFALWSFPLQYYFGSLIDVDPATFGQIFSKMMDIVNPAGPIIGAMGIPTQLGQNITALIKNYDEFSDRAIVPPEYENLPKEQQFDGTTTETAKRLSNFLPASPMEVQYLLEQGIWKEGLLAFDAVLRSRESGIDVEVQAAVDAIKAMEQVYGDEILPRNEQLRYKQIILDEKGFSDEQRKQIEDLLQKPDLTGFPNILGDAIPFITSFVQKFYHRGGGELYRLGLDAAAKKANITPEDWRYVQSIMKTYASESQRQMKSIDAAFLSTDIATFITPKQWKNGRAKKNIGFQMILDFASVHNPSLRELITNPDARADFMRDIATVAGASPDKRTESELLMAGWFSLSPPSKRMRSLLPNGEITYGREVEDMVAFFEMRDQFERTLTPAQLETLTLDRERTNSIVENEYETALKIARPYFSVEQELFRDESGNINFNLYKRFKDWQALDEAADIQFSLMNTSLFSDFLLIEAQAKITKEQLRFSNPTLDALLYKWDWSDTLMHPENIIKGERIIAPWRFLQAERAATDVTRQQQENISNIQQQELVPLQSQQTETRVGR